MDIALRARGMECDLLTVGGPAGMVAKRGDRDGLFLRHRFREQPAHALFRAIGDPIAAGRPVWFREIRRALCHLSPLARRFIEHPQIGAARFVGSVQDLAPSGV